MPGYTDWTSRDMGTVLIGPVPQGEEGVLSRTLRYNVDRAVDDRVVTLRKRSAHRSVQNVTGQ